MLIVDREAARLADEISDLILRIDQLLQAPDEQAEKALLADIRAMKNDAYVLLEKRGSLPAWAVRGEMRD